MLKFFYNTSELLTIALHCYTEQLRKRINARKRNDVSSHACRKFKVVNNKAIPARGL